MIRFVAMALGMGIVAGFPAQAQAPARVLNRVEVQVDARTDAGGAAPYCAMVFRLRNVGTERLGVFSAEVTATHLRDGAPLRMPVTTIPFTSVPAGEAREWTTAGAHGARCDQVRLQVTSVMCSRSCESVTWSQQGLGALQAPP